MHSHFHHIKGGKEASTSLSVESHVYIISFSSEEHAKMQLFSFLLSILLRGQLTEERYPSE